MARKLTSFFVQALKREFSFLTEWNPELNSAERAVTFRVARTLDPNTVWVLQFGRYNDEPDRAYTNGVTTVFLSDGQSLKRVNLPEGETDPADVVPEGTIFVLVKDEYRSELVQNEPGCIEYTLYKCVAATVAAITQDAARAAAAMRAELEQSIA